jgi:ParB-like chromosome segregation protein Spo0J
MPESELIPVELFRPDEEQAADIKRLAALGFTAKNIAVALGLERDEMLLFLRDAATPGTAVAVLMLQAVTQTQAAPQIKLHEAAEAGNVDAVKLLQDVQRRNQFNNMIEQMDDDEFTLYN